MTDMEALKHAYSRLTYSEFCRVIGNREDQYAEQKWFEFRASMESLGKLGTFIDRLIEYGQGETSGTHS